MSDKEKAFMFGLVYVTACALTLVIIRMTGWDVSYSKEQIELAQRCLEINGQVKIQGEFVVCKGKS